MPALPWAYCVEVEVQAVVQLRHSFLCLLELAAGVRGGTRCHDASAMMAAGSRSDRGTQAAREAQE